MNFDEFLKILGEFGSYQKRRYALICVMACYSVLSTLGIVFYGAEPEHHCKIPTSQVEHVTKLYGNVTRDELLELFVPYTKEGKRSGCALYRFNLGSMNSTVIALLKNSSLLTTQGGDIQDGIVSTMNYTLDNDPDIIWNLTLGERTDAHPCPGQREYSKDIYKSTVVSEFDLTCENAWQLSTCNSVFFGGKLVAMLVAGVMSDRFGRRPVFLVSVILLAASGISLAFAPNMAVFSVLYVIQGASDSSMYMTLYTMGMEFVGPSKRKITGLFMTVCFGLGHSLLAIEAYLLPNWRHLALVASSPGVICIFFWFFLSESVRWLLARGRHEEAKKIVNKVAAVNKVKLEEATLERLFTEGDEEKKTSTHTPIDLFRTWNRAKLTIIIIMCWLINDLCYYGLALHAQGLGGSIYLNFALLGVADIPGHIVGMFILDKVGRRKILLVTLLLGGVACIVSGFLSKDLQWLIITLAVTGKMFISFAGDVVQLVAAEIYPTVIRHVGISFCASVSRLGAVIAPQILALRHIYKPLPFIVWGVLTIATALLPFLLPETLGLSLPQTLEGWDARLNHGSLDDAEDESVDLQTKQETKDQSGEDCYRSHEEGDHVELAPINA